MRKKSEKANVMAPEIMNAVLTAAGNNFRILREGKCRTQGYVESVTGINISNISKFENGRANVGFETFVILAAAIEVPIAKITKGKFFTGINPLTDKARKGNESR